MNLLFLHFFERDYDVATPYERPIGGSESALCFVSVELARRGHRVVVANNTSQPRQVMGVECVKHRRLSALELRKPWDAVIALNGPADLSKTVKPLLQPQVPLVLWAQHAADQQPMHDLKNPQVRSAWDIVICLSTFHRQQMIEQYQLDPARVVILPNGIGPAFENLFGSAEELAAAKGETPVLAYTSTPFRGLNYLVSLFPHVRQQYRGALLQIYSSMEVYGQPELDAEYKALFDTARAMPGVEYVGSLPQPELAARLRKASFLAYPNTFAETYCIAAVEALAAGMSVVTSDLGALSETLMGQGALVPPMSGDADVIPFANRYTNRLLGEIVLRARDPRAFAERQFARVKLVNERCNYRVRAAQWEASIQQWPMMRLSNSTIV